MKTDDEDELSVEIKRGSIGRLHGKNHAIRLSIEDEHKVRIVVDDDDDKRKR